MTAQAPLEDYALLGDTRTAALVSSAGSIDWWCVPRFDSGPLCARLVGGDAAGHLDLGPATPGAVTSRDYVEDTPVLRTRWHCHGGAQLTLTEGMVSSIRGRLLPRHLLVRRIEAQGQPVAVRWAFAMRRPWSTTPLPRRAAGPAVILASGPLVVSVQACPPLPLAASETGTTTVVPGRPLTVTGQRGMGRAGGPRPPRRRLAPARPGRRRVASLDRADPDGPAVPVRGGALRSRAAPADTLTDRCPGSGADDVAA